MKRILQFEIICGEKTCASEPGKFCEWVATRRFGTEWHCFLFNVELEEEDGWLMRCTGCLSHEKQL